MSFKSSAIAVAATAVAICGATSSAQSQMMFGEKITTSDEAVAASSMAEEWLDGKIENRTKVTYSGPPITYRYASYLPAVAGIEKINKRALEQLTRDTNGKIVFKEFHSQSLHPQREGFTAVRDGIADFSACFMIYEPTSFHLLHGLTLPYLFEDSTSATLTSMALYPKYFKGEYENMGVYIGREFVTPPYNMIGSAAYRKMGDWDGSKVRVAGRVQIAAVKALGGVPVAVPSSEAYTALQRGLVDTVAMNDPAFMIFKLQEISKYHNQVSLFSVNLEYCLSQDWFNALPSDLKTIYYDWLQKLNVSIAQIYYERVQRRAGAIFEKAGVELITPDPGQATIWREAVSGIEAEWVAENEKAGRPAKAMMADLRATNKKFGAMSWNDQFKMVMEQPIKGLIDF